MSSASYVPYETRKDGYCRWRTSVNGRVRVCYVHQLTVIAYGADPYQVFSDGEFHVHHRNGIRYDNRPLNLILTKRDMHAGITFGHQADDAAADLAGGELA